MPLAPALLKLLRSACHCESAVWTRTLVFLLVLSAYSGTRAVAAPQSADEALAARVTREVRDYSHFTIFDDIRVSATDGRVKLTGRVTEPFKRTDLETRIAKLSGVTKVENAIRVLPASMRDADLRARIAQAIYTHPALWRYASLPRPPIHIIVEGGRVTLIGHVDAEADRTLAYVLAQVPGTFSVTNELKVSRRKN